MLWVLRVKYMSGGSVWYERDLTGLPLTDDPWLTGDLQCARVYESVDEANKHAEVLYAVAARRTAGEYSVCPVEVRRVLELMP